MTEYIKKASLSVSAELCAFIENQVLPETGIKADRFWQGFSDIVENFMPLNRNLLEKRETLQSQIDAYHQKQTAHETDSSHYINFLREIEYLVDEPTPFSINTQNVDEEIAKTAGPQLVVPSLNDRFVINAANARWGSLYDALYGTDVLDAPPAKAGGYDTIRGDAVIRQARAYLDTILPLNSGSWSDYHGGKPDLQNSETFIGTSGDNLLFKHNGLHIELVVDANHPIGKDDKAHIADVIVEAAITTIIDMEDSVAAVDAEDKIIAYRNWLGLMRGDLTASFEKNGKTLARTLNPDREYIGLDGKTFSLAGRSMMFVRNVGHLMTNPAIRYTDSNDQNCEIGEGLMDAVITSLIALHDLKSLGQYRNSRTGSINIVKPKMHGPEECALTNDIFDAIEDLLDLERHTIKVGVMDEERRTSANLAACIHAVKERIVFINTGFLDRTGDEIHTSMHGGPMVRKADIKHSEWISAYEARNVSIGLACGLSGKAQIGKGMWAMPDLMADMMKQKIEHPKTGANTAWVPSPTAATLHALHYHQVDVFALQADMIGQDIPALEKLLTIPFTPSIDWSDEEIAHELENNAQGILGYVVRWIDQGIGCSKVPDIHDVGLMEDRATLRISSQHMANWLLHNICSEKQVDAALLKMATKVDTQNAHDPLYQAMTNDPDNNMAYQAARELIFKGTAQPSGYTEPLLHAWRLKLKAS